MIAYTTLGTNRFDEAVKFYDALFEEIGASRYMETDSFVNWARGKEPGFFSIIKPFDGKPATVGNGVMIALSMRSPDDVDRVHKKAMELGATDEGSPGPRGPQFYCGYFRDLDGNKLNLFALNPG